MLIHFGGKCSINYAEIPSYIGISIIREFMFTKLYKLKSAKIVSIIHVVISLTYISSLNGVLKGQKIRRIKIIWIKSKLIA